MQVISCLLLIVIGNLLSVILPISFGRFYELVLEHQTIKSRIFEHLFLLPNTLTTFLLFFVALIILKSVSVYLEKYLVGLIGEKFSMELRQLLFKSQLNQTYTAFKSKRYGKYLLRYSGDMQLIQNLITKGYLGFMGDVLFVFFAFTVLFMIHVGLASFVVLAFLLGGVVVYGLGFYIKEIAADRSNRRSALLNFVSERLGSFYTIKSFNKEGVEGKKFLKLSKGLFQRGVKYQNLNAIILAIEPLFYYGVLAGIFSLYIVQPIRLSISLSGLLVFVLVLIYTQSAVKRILKVPVVWQRGKVSLAKFHKLILSEQEQRTNSGSLLNAVGGIRFEHVSYTFPDGKIALVNASFVLTPGEISCIKGRGKSTLFMLIQKIVEPQSGTIFIDEYNYADLSPFEIRKQVAIISEAVPLLGKTIFEAISYSPNEERRSKALEVLDLLGFNCSANDQMLDEPAPNSAGEQFMLKMARAILTDKKIILMEIPFHILNVEQTNILSRILESMKDNKTIVIAAEVLPPGFLISRTVYI